MVVFGLFAVAGHLYPRELRAVRSLLRRRLHFVWLRADLLAHLSCGVMVLAHKIGRAAYYMLKTGKAFDPMKFVKSK